MVFPMTGNLLIEKEIIMSKIKIYVDDVRKIPEDYDIRFFTVNDTIEFLQKMKDCNLLFLIEEMSLDHDAGKYYKYGGDYIKILDYMVENDIKIPIHIHSGNPVGIGNMRRLMQRYRIKEVIHEWDMQ